MGRRQSPAARDDVHEYVDDVDIDGDGDDGNPARMATLLVCAKLAPPLEMRMGASKPFLDIAIPDLVWLYMGGLSNFAWSGTPPSFDHRIPMPAPKVLSPDHSDLASSDELLCHLSSTHLLNLP